ncbi:MAG: peroxiredoxin family protein [Pirellulaceae bacterium]
MNWHSLTRTLLFIAALAVVAECQAQDRKTSRQLVASYETRYQKFVDAFKASNDTEERLTLINGATADINALFAAYVTEPSIADVLPSLANVKLVDLQPTFVKVIDEHPRQEVRALALLHFAQYSGNNERRKTCEAALGYLQRKYGKLPYRGTTFAKAADESLYFFRNLAIGCKAPPTVGEDADGAVFRLTDYRGKVIMLRFWGNWCPACRQMYGYERELVGKYRNQPFALIGVNSDSREECKRAQKESNLMWRSVWDGGTTHGAMSTIYRIGQWPTIIVIDAQGKIQYRSEGLDEAKLNRVIERLVAEASLADVEISVHAPTQAKPILSLSETQR